MSTLVLRLKAAESFLETSQCTWQYNSVEVQKNPDYEMWKEKILSGIGEDPGKPKIFTKKNVKNHLYHQFYPVLAKIRIKWVLL